MAKKRSKPKSRHKARRRPTHKDPVVSLRQNLSKFGSDARKGFRQAGRRERDLERRISKLSRQLNQVSSELASFKAAARREVTSSVASVRAELGNFKKASEKKVSSSISGVSSELSSFKKTARREVSSIVARQQKEHKKDVQEMGKGELRLGADLERVRSVVGAIGNRVSRVEAAMNPAVMKQIVSNLDKFSQALKAMERHNTGTLSSLEKTNTGIVAIAQHSRDIEREHNDAKIAASELAKRSANLDASVKEFFKQTEAVNGKLNANLTVLDEMTKTMALLSTRMSEMEKKAQDIEHLRVAVNDANKYIEQMAQRLAYFEKIAVKTYVIE
jgi:archaellum component FlaC